MTGYPKDPRRFFEKAFNVETNECIFWPYSTGRHGSAKITIEKKTLYICHIYCEKVYGPRPSIEYEVAHSCGNGHLSCINKKHLRWATHMENEEDKKIHETYGKKLTSKDVLNIRKLSITMSSRKISQIYKVKKRTINQIISRETWAYLNEDEQNGTQVGYRSRDLFS
jgi:hypothetical protein